MTGVNNGRNSNDWYNSLRLVQFGGVGPLKQSGVPQFLATFSSLFLTFQSLLESLFLTSQFELCVQLHRLIFLLSRRKSCLVQLTLFFGSNNMTWSPRASFLGTKLLNTQISRLPLINSEDRSQLCGNFLTNFRRGPLTKSLNQNIVSNARDMTSSRDKRK